MLVYLSITQADRVAWLKLKAQVEKCGVGLPDMQIMADQGWVELPVSQTGRVVVSVTPKGDEVVRNLVQFVRLGGQAS